MKLFLILLFIQTIANAQFRKDRIMYDGQKQLFDNEFTQAINTFNRIISYYPDNVDAYLFRGIAKYELSDKNGAEMDFLKAVELDTFRTDALYYIGILSIEKNKLPSALNNFTRAINIDDRHPQYFVSRSWVLSEIGDTANAIDDLNVAIKLNPEQDNAYINLAYLYSEKGNFDEAIRNCNKAIKIDPGNLNWRLAKGHIYQRNKNLEEAVVQYEYVLEHDSLYLQANYYLGLSFYEMEKYQKALDQFDLVLEVNSNNAMVYYYRGLVKYEMESYSDAINDFDKVLKLNTKNIYAFYARGIAKLNIDDYNGAERDFSAVIELHPLMLDAYKNRSVSRANLSDIEGFMEDRAMADTILKKGIPDFDLEDLSYMKQITSFKSDFTRVDMENESKVQYADYEIDMQPIYTISLKLPIENQYPVNSPGLGILKHAANGRFSYKIVPESELVLNEALLLALSNFTDSIASVDQLLLEYAIQKSLLLFWQNRYTESNDIIDKYYKLHTAHPLLSFIRGNNYLKLGKIIQSIEKQNYKLSELGGESSDTITNPIVLDYYNKAFQAYSKTIELNPGFYHAYYNRSEINYMLLNHLEAIFDLTLCIAQQDDFAEAYFNRALIHLIIGNRNIACRDLSIAGELGIKGAYRVIYYSCNN